MDKNKLGSFLLPHPVYTVFRKKVMYFTCGNNFSKCRSIFKILSLTDSQGNYVPVIETSTSPELCCYTTLWNFKIRNNRQLLLLPEKINLSYTNL